MNEVKVKTGNLIAVSAPSGSGKTTIVKEVLKEFPQLVFSVSATTRKRREGETDGKDYFFLSSEEFREKIENDEFVEWEQVYDGCYYGTFRSFLDDNLAAGRQVLMDVDVKGALSINRIYPDAILIYIVPPDIDELVNRLKKRKTEDEESLKKRIERAKMELSLKEHFDYTVLNDNLEHAVTEIKSLIKKIIKE